MIPDSLVLMWDGVFQMKHSACGEIRCWRRLQALCDFSQFIQQLCERWPSEGLHLRLERIVWLLITSLYPLINVSLFVQQAKNNCNLVLLRFHLEENVTAHSLLFHSSRIADFLLQRKKGAVRSLSLMSQDILLIPHSDY